MKRQSILRAIKFGDCDDNANHITTKNTGCTVHDGNRSASEWNRDDISLFLVWVGRGVVYLVIWSSSYLVVWSYRGGAILLRLANEYWGHVARQRKHAHMRQVALSFWMAYIPVTDSLSLWPQAAYVVGTPANNQSAFNTIIHGRHWSTCVQSVITLPLLRERRLAKKDEETDILRGGG